MAGAQPPAVLEVHERRDVQRLWSLVPRELEDEEDVVIPWRVRDLADAPTALTSSGPNSSLESLEATRTQCLSSLHRNRSGSDSDDIRPLRVS